MLLVFKVLGLACVTFLWVSSEPTTKLLQWFVDKGVVKNQGWVHRLLSCSLCSGFWIGILFGVLDYFFYYHTPYVFDILYTASLVSLVALFIDLKINK